MTLQELADSKGWQYLVDRKIGVLELPRPVKTEMYAFVNEMAHELVLALGTKLDENGIIKELRDENSRLKRELESATKEVSLLDALNVLRLCVKDYRANPEFDEKIKGMAPIRIMKEPEQEKPKP